MTKKRIHTIYSIALSVMVAIAGICLCVACVHIYRSGEQPFSRESVAAAFAYIALPVYLCLMMIAGGWILDIFFPFREKNPYYKQAAMVLAQVQSKLDLSLCEPALQNAIVSQRKKRKLLKIIGTILLSFCSGVFFAYSLNPANYDFSPTGITPSVIGAMFIFVPCTAIPFIYGIFASFAETRSSWKEIDLINQALAAGARSKAPTPETRKNYFLTCLRLLILFLAVGSLTFGFFAGGTADVLTKAINICTECVGLG